MMTKEQIKKKVKGILDLSPLTDGVREDYNMRAELSELDRVDQISIFNELLTLKAKHRKQGIKIDSALKNIFFVLKTKESSKADVMLIEEVLTSLFIENINGYIDNGDIDPYTDDTIELVIPYDVSSSISSNKDAKNKVGKVIENIWFVSKVQPIYQKKGKITQFAVTCKLDLHNDTSHDVIAITIPDNVNFMHIVEKAIDMQFKALDPNSDTSIISNFLDDIRTFFIHHNAEYFSRGCGKIYDIEINHCLYYKNDIINIIDDFAKKYKIADSITIGITSVVPSSEKPGYSSLSLLINILPEKLLDFMEKNLSKEEWEKEDYFIK